MISKKITPAGSTALAIGQTLDVFLFNSSSSVSTLSLILAYLTDNSIHVGVASGVDGILKGLKYILADFTKVIGLVSKISDSVLPDTGRILPGFLRGHLHARCR